MPYIHPMPTTTARAYQSGARDANGQRPERQQSAGPGTPCRHCLKDIPKGQEMLVLAYRPFPVMNPYAEVGPVFLCAAPCDAAAPVDALPDMFSSPTYLIKGYTPDHRIKYGTGQIVPTETVMTYAAELLEQSDIAYLHIRSAKNNCWQGSVHRDKTVCAESGPP